MDTVIIGTGRYEPANIIPNSHFLQSTFFDRKGQPLVKPTAEIVEKFAEVTGITERKYVDDGLQASDIATVAAHSALDSAKIDKESLDCLIVAHNVGDVRDGTYSSMIPPLAAKVKHNLSIANPRTISKDIVFGCPGWLEGVIDAYRAIKDHEGARAVVIGAEVLSKVCDPHDVDSMLYADGAGAVVLETRGSAEGGILYHSTISCALDDIFYLTRGPSYNPDRKDGLYVKMEGHRVYEFALKMVPDAVAQSLKECGIPAEQLKKIFIHQANRKLNEAVLRRTRAVCEGLPDDLMPLTIGTYGNSSVATIPMLFDLVVKGQMDAHDLKKGDVILFTSVGAGMGLNTMVYRMHQDAQAYR